MLGAAGAIAPHPSRNRPPMVPDGCHPPSRHLQLLGRPLHPIRDGNSTHGFCRAPKIPRLVLTQAPWKAILLGTSETVFGIRDLAYPGGPFFNPLGFGKDEKSMEELKLKEIKKGRLAICWVLLHSGSGHRGWTIPEPFGPSG
ncbi:Chlorophyll A-B binding protein [Cynara cardunculus var. scolymus]|uniref:Chlorophyll a-b binding protein, chloroplastic n=1 Tax=Cynara cardunculus var. scolymus TaxID=59895 RepID=A0A118K101_CYNCS|nr:Chlorophyll A-B binding protein [Cynara cardunculus var. scolymus]